MELQWWLINGKDWIAIVGGIVGLVGGITGLVSALRPPKIVVAHMDSLGVVISPDPTTAKLHLPMVISNLAKKPGVVTLLQLTMRLPESNQVQRYEWGLFWRENPEGGRVAERRPAPIPVPGFTCVERSLQFDSREPIQWEPGLYEFELLVRVGRKRASKRASKFYARPSAERCRRWYDDLNPPNNPLVDDIPIFAKSSEVPEQGT